MSSAVTKFGTGYVSFETFRQVCLTIGKIESAEINRTAKVPAFAIQLLFSPGLMKEHFRVSGKEHYTSSAQLVSNHSVEDLTGADVLCTVNFPRKQIGKMMSDCLVTGVQAPRGTADEKRETTIFMRPSSLVGPGSRVGILAEEEPLESNSRTLDWPTFASLDLRVGSVKEIELLDNTFLGTLKKVKCVIDFGEFGEIGCVGLFGSDFKLSSLHRKQVLTLVNLREQDLKERFEISDDSILGAICTVFGTAVIEPAKPVEPGFRLA